tara:strand:+ start:82 stop:657 length:576 start_codon:yes stop_codon:yes gene_type:complete
MASITSLPSGVSGSSLVLISEQTASSSSTISFTSGIDSTYKEYIFKFIDIHPSVNQAAFQFNMSADSGSNYNVTKTSSMFRAYHNEAGNDTALAYHPQQDLAQGTGFQTIGYGIGTDNDQSLSGELYLFEPSSTTFVKHFIATCNLYEAGDYSQKQHLGGYGNTTSAVDAIQFKMDSGNIDAGTIKMYGVV